MKGHLVDRWALVLDPYPGPRVVLARRAILFFAPVVASVLLVMFAWLLTSRPTYSALLLGIILLIPVGLSWRRRQRAASLIQQKKERDVGGDASAWDHIESIANEMVATEEAESARSADRATSRELEDAGQAEDDELGPASLSVVTESISMIDALLGAVLDAWDTPFSSQPHLRTIRTVLLQLATGLDARSLNLEQSMRLLDRIDHALKEARGAVYREVRASADPEAFHGVAEVLGGLGLQLGELRKRVVRLFEGSSDERPTVPVGH
jgi:hypothetical protein